MDGCAQDFGSDLKKLFPNSKNIRSAIRINLNRLRDSGHLKLCSDHDYRWYPLPSKRRKVNPNDNKK